LCFNAAGTGFSVSARASAAGADGGNNKGELSAAGLAKIAAFLAAAEAPRREKEVKCYPLESGYRRKHIYHLNDYFPDDDAGLSGSGVVHRAAHDRLVSINITIPDFQVEAAIRIGANPCFKLYGCALTAEIGQRYEVSGIALLTLGETDLFHGVLLPTENKE
jgi:hypothetical protein